MFREAKKVAKGVVAHGELALEATNPLTYVEAAGGAIRGKGFVVPGTKYIGPGNPVPKGGAPTKKSEMPTSKGDALALQHDLSYDRYINSGLKPWNVYTGYSDADKRLLHSSDPGTYHGLITEYGMLVKKGAYKLGLTDRIRDAGTHGAGYVASRGPLHRR